MAIQEGLIPFTGRMNNLVFYKVGEEYFARKRGGIAPERIKTERVFARTRENNAEFKRSTRGLKLLRQTFALQLKGVEDRRVAGRLTREMVKVVRADAVNPRGERNVVDGNLAILEGFDFNINGKLSSVFKADYAATIDRHAGVMTIDIPPFTPDDVITAPAGATHFRLKSAGAAIDFPNNTFRVNSFQSSDFSLIEPLAEPVRITHQVLLPDLPLVLVLGIEFVQIVNNVAKPFSDSKTSALTIVKVEKVPNDSRLVR